MFAGLAVGGLLAVAAGGGAGFAAFFLRSEDAGLAAGEAEDGGDASPRETGFTRRWISQVS